MITDTQNNQIDHWPVDLVAGAESSPVSVRTVAEAGRRLTATDDPNLRVLGRVAGSGGAFVDLAAAGIALGAPQADYELKARAALTFFDDSALVRAYLMVGIRRGSSAGWFV